MEAWDRVLHDYLEMEFLEGASAAVLAEDVKPKTPRAPVANSRAEEARGQST